MQARTLSARMLLRVVAFCRARGRASAVLLEGTGLTEAALAEPEARVGYGTAAIVAERALALTGDDVLGLHLAEDVGEPRHFDAGLLLLMASPTVGAALERMVQHQRFWGDGDRAKLLRPRGGGLIVRYALRGATGAYARHADECALAEIAIGVRALAHQDLRPRAVRFRHAAPPDTREHARVFGCPITFRTPHTELELDFAACATPMRHANEAFFAIFEQQVQGALRRLPAAPGASHTVRAAARAALASGDCTLATTARGLGLSARTLQRRLHAEGTSFAAVVDALRHELARAYLDRGVAIAEIASLLGYAGATAFHHAFRRWTGTTPQAYATRAAIG